MKNIDVKLKKVLDFMNDFIADNGYPPSVREICKELSIKSTATAYYYLEKLESLNLIKKTKSKNRAIEVVNNNRAIDNKITKIPLIGKITAGSPILAVENIEDDVLISNDVFKGGDLFMLKVSGDSMIDAGIFDKDKIIVKKQTTAENGQIVAALIENEATVKRFYKTDDKIILHPENKKYEDIILSDVSILGIIVGLIRKF